MSNIGIFFSLSEDINQPAHRGNIIKSIDACSGYIINNITTLINKGHNVDCNILINYRTELFPNLIDILTEKFANIPINIVIGTINYSVLKEELFQNINYYNDNEIKDSFDAHINDKDSRWIQIYQFLRQSFNNLKYDFYIRSRLDFFTASDNLFDSLIERFTHAYNFTFEVNHAKGYCITTEIILNGLDYGINISDQIYAMDKNAITQCFNNFSLMFKLKKYVQHVDSPGNCEEMLGHLLIKNRILTVAAPEANNMFIYRSPTCDLLPIEFLKDKNNLNEVCRQLDLLKKN